MADTLLAPRPGFGETLPGGRLGRMHGAPGVTVRALEWSGAAMLLARPDGSGTASEALRPLGLALPAPRRVTEAAPWQALWLGPERWLVTGPDDATSTLARAVDGVADVIDQSDARAALGIEGPEARALLARLFTVDLHPRAFHPGDVASTPAGHMAALLWQTDESPSFGIAVARSFAGNLAHWLIESAAPFGLLVEA